MNTKKKVLVVFLSLLLIYVCAAVLIHYKKKSTLDFLSLSNDSVCTQLDQKGVSYTDDREIKTGMNIRINLSCNLEELAISGAINQKINSSLWGSVEKEELIDLSSFEERVKSGASIQIAMEEMIKSVDINFDGYNDFEILQSVGSGSMAVVNTLKFLYNPKTKVFEYNTELAPLGELRINSEDKKILTFQGEGNGTYTESVYMWDNGKLLKTGDNICESESSDSNSQPITVRYKEVVYDKNGKPTVLKNEVQKVGSQSCVDSLMQY